MSRVRWKCASLAPFAAVLAVLVAPARALADFSITNFSAKSCPGTVTAVPCTESSAPAGSHRASTVSFDFGGDEHVHDIVQHFPPGIIPNPENLPKCAKATFEATPPSCPASSQLGTTSLTVESDLTGMTLPTVTGNVYNLQVDPPYVGGLGFITNPGTPAATALAAPFTLRSAPSTVPILTDTLPSGTPDLHNPPILPHDSDYGLTGISANVPRDVGGFVGIRIRHIEYTLNGVVSNGSPYDGNPYITLTPACLTGKAELEAASYEHPYPPSSAKVSKLSGDLVSTGCDVTHPPFNPKLPTPETDSDPHVPPALQTSQTDTPSGYSISLKLPDEETPPPGEESLHETYLREARVTLPKGTAISPSAANGLQACTDAQLGKGNNAPPSCPAASDIGDVSVESKNVDHILHGDIYVGEPTPSDTFRLFLAFPIVDGLWVKLKGVAKPDPATGQITTDFNELPPLPFTLSTLSLKGGDGAALVNPPDCGSHTIQSVLTPWRTPPDFPPKDDKTPSASFNTSYDGHGANCPSSRPFDPSGSGSTNPTQAGAHSTLALSLTNPDRDQLLKTLRLSMPPGLVGSLVGTPLCPAAQAAAGSCDPQSKIGGVAAAVGPGGSPLSLSGSIYLAQPLQSGDPASLAVVLPAKTGPYDFGNVVTRARVILRQDGGLDVALADDIPQIVGGIPIRLRSLSSTIDRPNFLVNPTSCAQLQFAASFTSTESGHKDGSSPYQATGCGALAFTPTLRFIATGETKQFGHPTFTAIVTQPPGQANIAKSTVVLPDILRPDTVPLNKPGALCQAAQLATRSCPATSQIGAVKATTPLLPQPLSGPVYIVQDPASVLPKLAVYLDGLVSIRLDAQNQLQGVNTVNVFDNVPDVAVSRFELTVKGGPNGILKSFQDLCSHSSKGQVTFVAHSGKTASASPSLEVPSCESASAVPRLSISLRGLRGDQPVLMVHVRRAPGGAKLKDLRLALPHSLQVSPERASSGVGVRASRKLQRSAYRLSRSGALSVRRLPGRGASSVTITLKGGVFSASPKLHRSLRGGKRPRLAFRLRIGDVGGHKFTIRRKVRPK